MGSPEDETGRIWTEGRQQEKTVESFALGISWLDAQGYCAWLSHRNGAEYRLPAEAEWE